MQGNSTYDPPNINALTKTALNFNGNKVIQTVEAGSTANLDWTLTDDHILTGCWLITNDGAYGDSVQFQILSGSTVLKTFIDWGVPPVTNTQIDIAYPAKLIAGLTLRLVYNSTGSNNVFVCINFKAHKIML